MVSDVHYGGKWRYISRVIEFSPKTGYGMIHWAKEHDMEISKIKEGSEIKTKKDKDISEEIAIA